MYVCVGPVGTIPRDNAYQVMLVNLAVVRWSGMKEKEREGGREEREREREREREGKKTEFMCALLCWYKCVVANNDIISQLVTECRLAPV